MEEVNDISCFIPEGLRDTTYHIAKIFHNKYKDSIRFARSNKSKSPVWHILDKNTQEWKMTIQNGIELRKILSEEFADLIIRARCEIRGKAQAYIDDLGYTKWSMTIDGERFQILSKLENKLYSAGSKSSILKEASELFYEDSIICVKD
jgi:hypothetical protein